MEDVSELISKMNYLLDISVMHDMHEHLVSIRTTNSITLQIRPLQNLYLHPSSTMFYIT